MRLVKDNSAGAWGTSVPCIGPRHHELNEKRHGHRHTNTMFTLAEGYADLDGEAFKAYYCDACAATIEGRPKYEECGCCGAYHPADWYGDCRDDEHRLYADQLDERHGPLGWEAIPNEEA